MPSGQYSLVLKHSLEVEADVLQGSVVEFRDGTRRDGVE